MISLVCVSWTGKGFAKRRRSITTERLCEALIHPMERLCEAKRGGRIDKHCRAPDRFSGDLHVNVFLDSILRGHRDQSSARGIMLQNTGSVASRVVRPSTIGDSVHSNGWWKRRKRPCALKEWMEKAFAILCIQRVGGQGVGDPVHYKIEWKRRKRPCAL